MVFEIFWLAIAVAIFMGCLIPVMAIWTRHREKIAQLEVEATAEKAARYVAENKEMEQRLQVLERIVTDRGYDTATQIEALRDHRAVTNAD